MPDVATVPKRTLLGAEDDDTAGGIGASGSEFTPGKAGKFLLKDVQAGAQTPVTSKKFKDTRASFADLNYVPRVEPFNIGFGNEGGADAYWTDKAGATVPISKYLDPGNFNVLGAEDSGAQMLKYLDTTYGTGWGDGLDAHMNAARVAHDAQFGAGNWGSGEGGSYHATEAMRSYLAANGMMDAVGEQWYEGRTATDTAVRERQIADRNAGAMNFGSFMSSFGSVLLPALAAWAAPLVMGAGGAAAGGAAGAAEGMTAVGAIDAAESLFRAPITSLGTSEGLSAAMGGAYLGPGYMPAGHSVPGGANGQWDAAGAQSKQPSVFDQIKQASDVFGQLGKAVQPSAASESAPMLGEPADFSGSAPKQVVEVQPGQEPGREVRGGAGGGAQAPSTVATFLAGKKGVDPREALKLGRNVLLGR